MALYIKNGWLDESGRVYIIFTIADVMESLSCAEQKANKRLNELGNVRGKGLIERKRRGLGNLTLCFYYVNLYVIKGKPVVRP